MRPEWQRRILACLCRLLFRRQSVFLLTLCITLTVVYIGYQAIALGRLGDELSNEYEQRKLFLQHSYQKADDMFLRHGSVQPDGEESVKMRGVRPEDIRFYVPNGRGNFVCMDQMEELPFYYVNDDVCDCSDGSDEPGTSACANGHFYCKYQAPHLMQSVYVLSSRVNDGLCDCCDGSDEWKGVRVPVHVRVSPAKEDSLGVDQTPCRNRCA